jgi:hypothetical protein
VATVPNDIAARLSAQCLAAAGIRCVLVPLGGGLGVVGTATMLIHELRVLARDAPRARRLLTAGTRPRRRYGQHVRPAP